MRAYMEAEGCLMQFLAEELSDPEAAPCGKCANCTGERLGAAYPARSGGGGRPFPGAPLVAHRTEKAMAPRLPHSKANAAASPPSFMAAEGRALCKWGDAGFGDLVRDGKRERALRGPPGGSRRGVDPTPLEPAAHDLSGLRVFPSHRHQDAGPGLCEPAGRAAGAAVHRVRAEDPRDGPPEDPPKQFSASQQSGECVRGRGGIRPAEAGVAGGRYGGFPLDVHGSGLEAPEGRRRSGLSICLGRLFG